MKTTVQKRLGHLAGLLLLSLLVFATGIQVAQAATVAGSSGPVSATTPTQLNGLTGAQRHEHGSGFPVPGGQTAAQAASSATSSQLQGPTAADQRAHDQGSIVTVPGVSAAQGASSGTSSTTAWIAAGSAAAALIVGIAVWALVRRRRQRGGRPSAAYCAQHPEDALCTMA